jgi:serine/threonine protein kinase
VTEVGELIAGRYRLVARVGQGAMGVVWRARDERLDRVVAVKQLLPGIEADELARREGRVAARLRHPHAVMVHDAVEHDGRPCLIMEYFEARSLGAVVMADGVLSQEAAANVGSQIASALAAAHADGIVHRDVKPANVLIAADGTAKLVDFGISRALGDGTMTGSEILVGTPAYLAPEVASGEQAGFSSDVFSLGATLYTALEGAPPFGLDNNAIALLHRVAHREIAPPRQSGPLVDAVLWMMRRNPGERPTMDEVNEVLAAIADGRPAKIPSSELPPHTPTLVLPARRVPRRAIAGGIAAALLLTAGVVIGVLLADRPGTVNAANTEPSRQPPVSTTTTTTASGLPCEARYNVTTAWPGGYQVIVTVLSNDRPRLAGWTVSWALPAGHSINNLWGGEFRLDGDEVTVRNESWNAAVARDEPVTFGLNVNAPTDASDSSPAVTCQSP